MATHGGRFQPKELQSGQLHPARERVLSFRSDTSSHVSNHAFLEQQQQTADGSQFRPSESQYHRTPAARSRVLSFRSDSSHISNTPAARGRGLSFISDVSTHISNTPAARGRGLSFISDVSTHISNTPAARGRGLSFRSDASTHISRYTVLEQLDPEKVLTAKKEYIKNLLTCSVAFFLLFSSFVGLAIVQGSIHGQVGIIGLVVIFLITIVSCMVISPLLIQFLGYKYSMVLCFVSYLIWELANFYPSWGVMMPAAMICGIGNGAIWSSQATYFSQKNITYSAVTGDNIQMVIARSFGIFFCFLLSGSSFGCLMTSLILTVNVTTSNHTSGPVVPGPLPHCGSGFCPNVAPEESDRLSLFYKNKQSIERYNDPDPFRIYILITVHVIFTLVGIVLMCLFLENTPLEPSDELSVLLQAKANIKYSFRQLKRKRQILMMPLNIYTGMSKSFMMADITQAYIACALGIDMVGYGSVTYGLVSCLSAMCGGFIIKKTGRIPMFSTACAFAFTMMLFLLFWIPDSSNKPMFFVIPSIWAIHDGIFISQMNSFYGYMFHDNIKGAFAAFRFYEGIGLVTGYLCIIFLCVNIKIYSMLVLLVFGMIGYFVTENVQGKLQKSNNALQTSVDIVTASFINTTLQDSFNTSRTYNYPWSQQVTLGNYVSNLPVLTEEDGSDITCVNSINRSTVFETAV